MGKRNFWMPSKRKTPPTASRISNTAAGALLLIMVMLLAVSFLPSWPRMPTDCKSIYFGNAVPSVDDPCKCLFLVVGKWPAASFGEISQ